VQLVRTDRNGTVTLVIIRDTEGPTNSTYATLKSKTPPKLALQMIESVVHRLRIISVLPASSSRAVTGSGTTSTSKLRITALKPSKPKL